MNNGKEGQRHAIWRVEYETLERLWDRLDSQNLHIRAQEVADRLSEMELEEPAFEE